MHPIIQTLLGVHFSEEREKFLAEIFQSAKEGHLCYQTEKPSPLPPLPFIVQDQDRYYVQKNWIYETELLKHVRRLRERKFPNISFDISKEGLNQEQREVVEHLFSHSFAVVCGGPGTGKTYTAARFIKLFSLAASRKLRVAFTAPTGKAALHLQSVFASEERISCEAVTLHRLLHLRPSQTDLFTARPLDFDIVVVDEASMIDVSLLSHLLASIGDHTRLILMGDPNQLPPVEGGGIFAEWAALFGKSLSRCMRTEDERLARSAASILASDSTKFFESVDWRETMDLSHLYNRVSPLFSREKIDPLFAISHFLRFRVLNALRQGPLGTQALNQALLDKLEGVCPPGFWWAVPILSTANAPHLDLSNGSFGVLIGQKGRDLDLSQGVAYFAGQENRPFAEPPPYELSFLLSIHKSQGSEFEEVLALFPEGSEVFGKEVLYTAATRAKKRLEVWGKKEGLEKLLSRVVLRRSGFSERWPAIG